MTVPNFQYLDTLVFIRSQPQSDGIPFQRLPLLAHRQSDILRRHGYEDFNIDAVTHRQTVFIRGKGSALPGAVVLCCYPEQQCEQFG